MCSPYCRQALLCPFFCNLTSGTFLLQRHSEAMEALLTAAAGGKPKPALVFVGATVQDSLAATAVAMGWMEQPQTVAVGQVRSCWGAARVMAHQRLVGADLVADCQNEVLPVDVCISPQGGIPRALRHTCIECEAGRTIAVLCRQIRADLNACAPPPACTSLLPASVSQPSKRCSSLSEAQCKGNSTTPRCS
jgi:hypothetical protein